MSPPTERKPDEKSQLHPRNPHRTRYDFPSLVRTLPALQPHVRPSGFGHDTVDFADPAAVKALNQALLKHFYDIAAWDIPPGYLCPPIPGRADYIHYAADLLAADHAGAIPNGPRITVLDVGVGANCIYPLIGRRAYGWRFAGSEIDAVALANARRIVAANPGLAGGIELRLQPSPRAIFRGVIMDGERFALCLCNPPFHASAAEAGTGTRRKVRNLGRGKSAKLLLNFGGRSAELWCTGGELAFVERMISESAQMPAACGWFTTLLSKKENLPPVRHALRGARAVEVKIIPMAQGQKQSRIVAWTFLSAEQRKGPI